MTPNEKKNKTKNPQVPTFLKSKNLKLFNVSLETALGKGNTPNIRVLNQLSQMSHHFLRGMACWMSWQHRVTAAQQGPGATHCVR